MNVVAGDITIKMKKLICDKCNKDITNLSIYQLRLIPSNNTQYKTLMYDLCIECSKLIEDFMKI